MRVILSLLVAASVLGTLSCGSKERSQVRQRGNLSEADYHEISGLNTALSDYDAAVEMAITSDGLAFDGPSAMISSKATAMGKALQGERRKGVCGYKHVEPSKSFGGHWRGEYSLGGEACPVFSTRTWEYNPRTSMEVLSLYYNSSVKQKEWLEQTGVRSVITTNGQLWTKPNPTTGTIGIQGGIQYDVVLASGERVRAVITTTQSYRGNTGNGSVTIRLSSAGWTRVGTITWKGNDFSKRIYAAEGGKMEHENFLKLFSYFRLDEIVDNSERMR